MVDGLEVPTSLEKDHGQMGKEHPSEEMAARDKDGELRSGKRRSPLCWVALLVSAQRKETLPGTEVPRDRAGTHVEE